MTDKSQFLHMLEALIPREQVKDLDKCDAVIIDGNAAIHMLQVPNDSKPTLQDMADDFTQYIKRKHQKICSHDTESQIHVVFDRNMDRSIKSMTVTGEVVRKGTMLGLKYQYQKTEKPSFRMIITKQS